MTTLAKILLAPWEYYKRTAAFTFTAVLSSNTATTCYDSDRRALLFQWPATMSTCIVGKSLLFAPIWPAWYMTAAIHPRSAFYLGGGVIIEQLISDYNDVINDMFKFNPTITYEDGRTVVLDSEEWKRITQKPSSTL